MAVGKVGVGQKSVKSVCGKVANLSIKSVRLKTSSAYQTEKIRNKKNIYIAYRSPSSRYRLKVG
jgi:hypothetical protein